MSRLNPLFNRRQKKLLDLIREHGQMQLTELSEKLNVSIMTIRRDVDHLETAGVLERFHGGARIVTEPVPVDEDDTSVSMSFQPGKYKDAIAKAAADLVEDGDIVFVNSGTTTLSVLRYLNNRPVRVITNNALAPVFMEDARMELTMTGGTYRHESMALIGDLAISNLTRFYANKCILGAKGVSFERGVTTRIQTGSAINDMMINQLRGPCIIVADGSKIGRIYEYVNTGIDRVNILITDQTANQEELEKIRRSGVRVIIVEA